MPLVPPPRSARQASARQAARIEGLKHDGAAELPPHRSPRRRDNTGRTHGDGGSSLDLTAPPAQPQLHSEHNSGFILIL